MPSPAHHLRSPATNERVRQFAAQALSRTAGAPLIGGNSVDLLIDAQRNFDAWHAAIRQARHSIFLENYIFRDDDVARAFRDALVERAESGVSVHVIRDWLGCLGQSPHRFWKPLIDAGGQVRTYNPPNLASPFGWLSRDHRKLLIVDTTAGFVSGICVSAKWLGDESQGVPPWRDTGVAIRGPALGELIESFEHSWQGLGEPLDLSALGPLDALPSVGDVDLRVVATIPNAAGLYRMDHMIAAMATKRLWLTDAYFVGIAPYLQALISASDDGVDVRLLVPGSSDIPALGGLSRAGYRPLLEAGVRVFEWNGSMLHAKTSVADGRWARVGSSNLNLASWIGNCELDVAVENEAFARCMEEQYERDLQNSTEIVLGTRSRVRREALRTRQARRRRHNGSSSRAAAGALRLANTMGAAITNRRPLGPAESGSLGSAAALLALFGVLALVWPALIAWPLGVLAIWFAILLFRRFLKARRGPGPSPGADPCAKDDT